MLSYLTIFEAIPWIGTSRTDPPRNSVGEWLQLNVTRTALASYVGPILITEGYAEKAGGSKIRFL